MQLQPQVFLGMTWQALNTWSWGFSADSLKLCQVGHVPSVDSHFKVSPEMFDWVQVRALARPFKDRAVPNPLLWCLGCVLRIIVMLVNFHPSLRSWELYTFSFPSTLTSHPVPATEKDPHSMMLPQPCFTTGMVLGRWLPDVMLSTEAKSFSVGFIRPQDLVS